MSLTYRIFVWLCGRFGHGKQDLIEEYTRNITHPPYQVHGWLAEVTVIQGKWRCRCCHNVSIRSVEVRSISIDRTV